MRTDFTSRHFRTWAATANALDALGAIPPPESATAKKQVLNREIDKVARALGNTRAVCRGSYIHPEVPAHWLEDRLGAELEEAAALRVVAPQLSDAERRALKWLLFLETR